MRITSYEILDIRIKDTKEAQKGKDIFYQCNICQSIISSTPEDSLGCSCGNIGIDKDLNRLYIEDYSSFVMLKKKA